MVTKITNFSEFSAQLAQTIKQISETRAKAPDDVLEYVEKQLRDVQGWTSGGDRPSAENLRSLSFGVVASRDINDRYPEMAEQLFALADYLVHWK
jgi:nitroreductase